MTSTGSSSVDFYGQVKSSGNVGITTGPLYLRDSALITLDGDVSLTVNGRYDMRGSITYNGHVDIHPTSYYLYGSHSLAHNTSCAIHGTKLGGSVNPNGCAMAP